MKWDRVASTWFAFFGGLASALLGTWDLSLQTLVLLMSIDYITGVTCGYQLKTLSSQTAFTGILKKIMILAVVAVAVSVDNIIGADEMVRNLSIYFFIGMDGISILENAARIGVPIPEKLKDSLIQLKEGNRKDIMKG